MAKFKLKRKIKMAGITVSVFMAVILGRGEKQADAASAPKFAGVEKVIYLDGRNEISVEGKHIVSVKYASSRSNIATVNSKGIVRPRAKGKTEISASVIYKKKASGKKYTKKLKYKLKILGKSEEYFDIFKPSYKTNSGYAIQGMTAKGKELEKVYIPSYVSGKQVKRLYSDSLRDSSNMVSLHLSDKLRTIYGGVVVDCPKLERLYIGKELSQLGGSDVFLRCSALEEIILDDRNKNFVLEDGVLFSSDKKELLLYPRAELQSSYTIPNGVERIGSGAFAGSKHLKEVIIPESVEWLHQRCFSGSGLLAVDIPDEVQYMGNSVFQSCASLSEVKLSKRFTQIPINTFKKCISLKSIFLPAGINWLNSRAFAGCSQLQQFQAAEANQNFYTEDGVLFAKQSKQLICYPVGRKQSRYHVPEGTISIEEFAFNQCLSLESIEFPEGLQRIGENAFDGSGIKEMVMPDTVTSVGFWAFQDCRALSRVKLSKALVNLSYGTFSGCGSLEEIEIPKEVSTISSDAFSKCDNLKRILVDKENTTFTDLNGVLFSKSMKTLYHYPNGREDGKYTIPSTVTTIRQEAFSGAKWLIGVSVPDSVRSIGYNAFRGCDSLENVKLPKELGTIESGLFALCGALKKIVLPSSVKKINDGAFTECTSLESFVVPAGVESLGYQLFSGCSSLKEVRLGKGVKTIESNVFENCTQLKKLEIITKKLTEKSIGKNVFLNAGKDKGKKLVVEVPADKLITYKKLLIKKGLPKYAVIKQRAA